MKLQEKDIKFLHNAASISKEMLGVAINMVQERHDLEYYDVVEDYMEQTAELINFENK